MATMRVDAFDFRGNEKILDVPIFEPLIANLPRAVGHDSSVPGLAVQSINRKWILADLASAGLRGSRVSSRDRQWFYIMLGNKREDQIWLRATTCDGFMRVPGFNGPDEITAYLRVDLENTSANGFLKLTGVNQMPGNPGRVFFSPVPFEDGRPLLPNLDGILNCISMLISQERFSNCKAMFDAFKEISHADPGHLYSLLIDIGAMVLEEKGDGYISTMTRERFEAIFGIKLP